MAHDNRTRRMKRSEARREPEQDWRAVPVLPLSTRALYWAAQAALHLALPLLVIVLLGRARRERGFLHGLSERFGLGARAAPGSVWIYAASLGETRAASPLIRELRAAGYRVLLTHQTPAGLDEGWRLFPDDDGIVHRYVPIDLFWAVRLFLKRNKVALGIVLEIEIWPAMLLEARRAHVPMIMANGNMLKPSMARNHGLRAHLLRFYREFTHVFTRTDEYRDRYLALGVAPERISVVGDLKYDQWIVPEHPERGRTLRAGWRGVEKVLMIASSVRDEEPALLDMVAGLLGDSPGLGVVWAPRSPQRFDAVARALQDAGLSVARRSDMDATMTAPIPNGTQVLLGDSLGEMNIWYAMADLVFVGASLVNMGGHNLMEPFALGKPVVMGPSIYSIEFAARDAATSGAFESLPDAVALRARVAELLSDEAGLNTMARQALSHGTNRTGAASRTLAGLRALLPPADDGPSGNLKAR